jgi:hypothetical protein
MVLDIGVDVAHALLLQNLVNGNEDSRLLHVAEAIIDGGAEEFHRRTEVHVCVYERRDKIKKWGVIL